MAIQQQGSLGLLGELELKEGRNRISYTQYAPNKGVSIKYFKLRPVKLDEATAGVEK